MQHKYIISKNTLSAKHNATSVIAAGQTSMSVLIIGPKCALAVSHAAPWWIRDRRTPDRYNTLSARGGQRNELVISYEGPVSWSLTSPFSTKLKCLYQRQKVRAESYEGPAILCHWLQSYGLISGHSIQSDVGVIRRHNCQHCRRIYNLGKEGQGQGSGDGSPPIVPR